MLESVAQMKQFRAAAESEETAARSFEESSSPATVADENFELSTFQGTLIRVECPTPSKLVVSVKSGDHTQVLSGDVREVSVGGKPLYCHLRGGKVSGYYQAKASKLVALKIEDHPASDPGGPAGSTDV